MAKKSKMKSDKAPPDFHELMSQLTDEQREMFEMLGINSLEDILGLSVMLGIDPNKMENYYKEHGDSNLPSMEEVMFDDDDSSRDFYRMMKGMSKESDAMGTTDGDDDDPFLLPEKILFEDEPSQAYHLRIKLNNAPVPIWREVEVPSNISLEFFAFVILESMGWENEHLHQFKKGNTTYKNSVCIKQDQEMFSFFGSRFTTLSSEGYPISTIFKEKGDRIEFEYDFGDSWYHDIWLKGIREYQPNELQEPKLLKGKGMCPPEDCGGIGGYTYLLEILSKKRKSAEDKERLEWYGIEKGYDPNEFNKERTKRRLYYLWEDAME